MWFPAYELSWIRYLTPSLSRQDLGQRVSRRFTPLWFGLRQKFVLAFTGLVLVPIVSLLFVVENRQHTSIVHQMKKRGIAIASQLAAASTRSLLAYDYIALEQDAAKVSQDPDILYTIILDRAGTVAAYSDRDNMQGLVLQDPVSQKAAMATEALLQSIEWSPGHQEHYDVAVPVFLPQTTDQWGLVRIGLSLAEMRADIHQTRVQVLILGVVGVLLSMTAAVFLARRIAAPIQALTAATVAMARGEDLPPIEVRSGDEIGVLATNFNAMTSELSKHRADLEEVNRELSQKYRELSQLAAYNDNILRSMCSGLFTLDLAGRFETFNAIAETIMGLKRDEVVGQFCQEVLKSHPQFVHIIEASRLRQEAVPRIRLELEREDGQRVPLEMHTEILHDGPDERPARLLVLFEDLSPIQELERRLRRADRSASLGQVASVLAHEVRNPLQVVKTFVQLVRRKHHDEQFMQEFDRVVQNEVNRIDEIVNEFLDVTRPTPLLRRPLDVREVLQPVVESYAETRRQQRVELQTDWPATLPRLDADAEQLRRAFGNLTLNALEAMPEGGVLGIVCRAVPRSVGDIVTSSVREENGPAEWQQAHYGPDVEIVFRDTGEGIPADKIDALFTPYFTTKKRGTGLGLALTHKIIEEHGGRIEVVSMVGKGTTFTIVLPSVFEADCLMVEAR